MDPRGVHAGDGRRHRSLRRAGHAVVATVNAIITYRSPLTREIVTPLARPDHSVGYFARDLDRPIAVFLAGAGLGASPEERIQSRLVALESGPASHVSGR